jgi:hypothetical protein
MLLLTNPSKNLAQFLHDFENRDTGKQQATSTPKTIATQTPPAGKSFNLSPSNSEPEVNGTGSSKHSLSSDEGDLTADQSHYM